MSMLLLRGKLIHKDSVGEIVDLKNWSPLMNSKTSNSSGDRLVPNHSPKQNQACWCLITTTPPQRESQNFIQHLDFQVELKYYITIFRLILQKKTSNISQGLILPYPSSVAGKRNALAEMVSRPGSAVGARRVAPNAIPPTEALASQKVPNGGLHVHVYIERLFHVTYHVNL